MPMAQRFDEDRRRSIRLRRSALTSLKLDGIDCPSIKIAEETDELLQAFRLVQQEYVRMGYVPQGKEFHFGIHNLLPETCVYVFKSYSKVVASLTQIFDSEAFGLPMDALFADELDGLRNQGRNVAELTSFVTSRDLRWRNIMTYLCKAMFVYSKHAKADDLCIMVNPRHVPFYKRIFLFDDFGPERHYERVNAPAVALRIDMHEIDDRLKEKYSGFEFDTDLHKFFCRVHPPSDELVQSCKPGRRRALLDMRAVRRLLADAPGLADSLNHAQAEYIESVYPGFFVVH
ncbi:hypothetical protein DPQ33_11110 [Oceanidesulfovibrio indonesiensis]|uniref:N-acyl amino acid synthase FeeM catalytic core domain-containing protein n=1 Tax=Oceanidesulfovibrio indonesiensis TaxID=54767 RepID=A0A7M3MF22_9BACT|nr:hypothetical protein [Oceanidesulfovibrio indonesiensis]TVM16944.1 hypothetical protein DPQ33_11110 [Oceanidesulfovibrio indonesiensis]